MFRIALSTLRHRKGGFVATFVALFVGTAVLLACGGLMETGVRTVIPPQRLAAAPIVVAGDQAYDLPMAPGAEDDDQETATLPEGVRLDAGLAGTIGRIPGVARVIPDVSFPAVIPNDDGASAVPGTQRGHSWDSAALAPYRLSDGRAPARAGEVVLDDATAGRLGARPGGKLDVAVPGGVRTFTVVGVATAGRTMATDAVFFAPGEAESLTRTPGRVDAFGVLPAADADLDALRARIDDAVRGEPARTLVGDDRGLAEFGQVAEDGEQLIVLAAVFGLLAVQIVMFVVASTLTLSVQQRRREIATLRAVGTTPKQLSRMIRGETMTVGVLATLAAIVPGGLLGEWLFDRLTGFGVVQPVLEFHQGLFPAIAATLIGLGSARVAASVTAHYARRTRPVEAMRETTTPTRWLTQPRLWLGVFCLVCAVVLAYLTVTVLDGPVAASTAGPAVTCVAAAVALFAPGVTRMFTAALRVPVRAVTGVPGYLATLNTRARWLPMAGAVTPVMLATGLAIFMIYFQTTQTAAAEKAYADSLVTDAVVEAPAGDVTDDLVSRVAEVPGVGAATAFVTSTGYPETPPDPARDDDGVALHGVTSAGAERIWRADVRTGGLSDLRGDTIALPGDVARRLGTAVGDDLTLRLGDGAAVTLRVVATLRTAESAALLPAETLAPHTTAGAATRILVTAAPGTGQERLRAALAGELADQPGVRVSGRDALAGEQLEREQANAWVNYLVVGLLLVYAAISMVNTLVLATGHRRREFGLQRLTGSTRGQVMRMMTVEALMVAVIGCVLGSLVAATMLVPFSVAFSGSPIPSGPLWIYPSIIGQAVVLTVVATWVPTWLSLRTRPSPSTLAPE